MQLTPGIISGCTKHPTTSRASTIINDQPQFTTTISMSNDSLMTQVLSQGQQNIFQLSHPLSAWGWRQGCQYDGQFKPSRGPETLQILPQHSIILPLLLTCFTSFFSPRIALHSEILPTSFDVEVLLFCLFLIRAVPHSKHRFSLATPKSV